MRKEEFLPLAFQMGLMSLESGEVVEVRTAKKKINASKARAEEKRTKKVKRSTDKSKYAYWAENYPNHVVIKKEGYFWTCRGESARIVSELLGYNLGGNPDNPVTGTPNLDAKVEGLNRNKENYIVVEDGEISDQGYF